MPSNIQYTLETFDNPSFIEAEDTFVRDQRQEIEQLSHCPILQTRLESLFKLKSKAMDMKKFVESCRMKATASLTKFEMLDDNGILKMLDSADFISIEIETEKLTQLNEIYSTLLTQVRTYSTNWVDTLFKRFIQVTTSYSSTLQTSKQEYYRQRFANAEPGYYFGIIDVYLPYFVQLVTETMKIYQDLNSLQRQVNNNVQIILNSYHLLLDKKEKLMKTQDQQQSSTKEKFIRDDTDPLVFNEQE